jgi:hypothetical protein
MPFHPAYLINVGLAVLALYLYIVGSYRFYREKEGFILFLGAAIFIDVMTATLASLKITPTAEIPEMATIPWYSWLFRTHVILSMIGFVGFISLFIYLLYKKGKHYSNTIRIWQFKLLLPIWIIGECIALSNALSKIIFKVRLFDLL